MSLKRVLAESVVSQVSQDPCDTVKVGLPESQSPEGGTDTPVGRTLEIRRHTLQWSVIVTNATSKVWSDGQ
ncbi:MAG: hypothetical protein HZB51_22530 [Chloroflexi bacterium]|nr:hypothetical protein [Chloroflexota bacterium]